MLAPPNSIFISRSKEGLQIHKFNHESLSSNIAAQKMLDSVTKHCRFSPDGKRLIVPLPDELIIFSLSNFGSHNEEVSIEKLASISVASCVDFVISPSGRYLATYTKAAAADNSAAINNNLRIWRVESDGKVDELAAFAHKNQSTWMPQWTSDENYMARMVTNEVQFYRTDNMHKVSFRIHSESVTTFALSPGPYPKAAMFTKETKSMPGSVKVYLLPNTSAPVAQKSFFKADRCELYWSPTGRHLLAHSTTEVDSTGVSYYGESNLYFISGDGSFDAKVELDKEGPIHDVAWSPKSDEFIVLYGYMPAKAMLFDNKCLPTFEFSVGSKNHVRWNPQGSLICFGGFGNLQGHIEVWSRNDAIRRVGHCQAQGTSYCEWSPDGSSLLTGVLTPRLRVDNGWKMWSWKGELLSHVPHSELYQLIWRPMPGYSFKSIDLTSVPKSASGPLEQDTSVAKAVYIPPSLRNKIGTTSANNNTVKATPAKAAPSVAAPSTMTKEEKLVKKLKEKLDQIDLIKMKMEKGEPIELNQAEKVAREDQLRKEYETALAAINK